MLGGGGGMISLKIENEDQLYLHFMPFVEGGGLFLPTKKAHKLGDEIFFLLDIYLDSDPMPLTGKVVWLNPQSIGSHREAGIGVQLGVEHDELVKRIEQELTGRIHSQKPTHTI